MKKYLLVLFAVCVTAISKSQTVKSCCVTSATDKFSSLGSNTDFVKTHEEPLPFVFKGNGKDIYFKTSDGKDAHAWEIKAAKPTNVYLLVIHEWWGLNDYVKQQGEKMCNDLGINVLAIDLYDNQVATTREDAAKYMQAVTQGRAKNIIKGALAYAGDKAQFFTIGWCFGGGWSLQTAIEAEKRCKGCIMFYGMPEEDITRLKTLNCDVLGIFAKKDEWINKDVVDKFEANMKSAGKKLTVAEYDADHAFANPSNPHFDKEAAEDAYTKVKDFIKARM